MQLHPGDLGWNWSFGAQKLADQVHVWRREGQILAAGMMDAKDEVIRMAIALSVDRDESFASHLLADLSNPSRGLLPAERGSVEARFGAAFRDLLQRSGWVADEPWTPLRRDLTAPVEDCGLRIEVLDADHVEDRTLQDRVAVGRASFHKSTFNLERWRAMAASATYRRARCLVAYDKDAHAVAATTVCRPGADARG